MATSRSCLVCHAHTLLLFPRPSTAEFLGFQNKTCIAGTSAKNYGTTAGPVLRSLGWGTQWKQWTLLAVSKPAANGAVDVVFTTYYLRFAKPQPRCLGNMVAEKPMSCVSSDRYADRAHIHPHHPEGEHS